jgi:hypothetical protein
LLGLLQLRSFVSGLEYDFASDLDLSFEETEAWAPMERVAVAVPKLEAPPDRSESDSDLSTLVADLDLGITDIAPLPSIVRAKPPPRLEIHNTEAVAWDMLSADLKPKARFERREIAVRRPLLAIKSVLPPPGKVDRPLPMKIDRPAPSYTVIQASASAFILHDRPRPKKQAMPHMSPVVERRVFAVLVALAVAGFAALTVVARDAFVPTDAQAAGRSEASAPGPTEKRAALQVAAAEPVSPARATPPRIVQPVQRTVLPPVRLASPSPPTTRPATPPPAPRIAHPPPKAPIAPVARPKVRRSTPLEARLLFEAKDL